MIIQEISHINRESLVKIHRANRLVGGMHAIIVVTADTMGREPVEEFYVFHRFSDVKFLYQSTTYSPSNSGPFDFGIFPQFFSARPLLERSFRKAKERLEFEIRRSDRELHRELFWSATPMSYEETDDLPLIEIRMFGGFVEERALMAKRDRAAFVINLSSEIRSTSRLSLRGRTS